MPPPPPARSGARQRLLDAADELFYAEGIAGTGVDAVLARSGAAIGSLYSHFGGKDGLVLAYLEAREDRWRARWDALISQQHDAAARVLTIFDVMCEWMRDRPSDHGCAHAAAIAQLPDSHPAHAAALGWKRDTRTRLAALVDELPVADSAALAADLHLLYEGAMVAAALGDPDAGRRARATAADLIARRQSGT